VRFDEGFAVHPKGAKGRADEDKHQDGIELALNCFDCELRLGRKSFG
jgi:hypothetical protein